MWDHIDYAGGKQGISIIDNDIKHVVNGKLISSITDSWQKDSVARGKLGVCAQKCGSEFDPMRSNGSNGHSIQLKKVELEIQVLVMHYVLVVQELMNLKKAN